MLRQFESGGTYGVNTLNGNVVEGAASVITWRRLNGDAILRDKCEFLILRVRRVRAVRHVRVCDVRV